MTVHQSEGTAPTFDQADRMRKALRTADMSVKEMADYLGVARNTVSTWINGRIQPSVQTLRLWALATGVPLAWLQTGESPNPEGGESSSDHLRPVKQPAGAARKGSRTTGAEGDMRVTYGDLVSLPAA